MDTSQIYDKAILVNFRAPKSVIETLDQLSRFQHRTRTSVLLDLITGWINERTYDIPLKVRQMKDLKTVLNSCERPALESLKPNSTSLIEITPRSRSVREPLRFYSS